jgi:NAD(P)-dependent dehydrogenase (short-subunit alcohol dehydrogenase family)
MAGIPMGRFQEPENVAALVLFLASEDASEMTGQAVNVTGGMVMD